MNTHRGVDSRELWESGVVAAVVDDRGAGESPSSVAIAGTGVGLTSLAGLSLVTATSEPRASTVLVSATSMATLKASLCGKVALSVDDDGVKGSTGEAASPSELPLSMNAAPPVLLRLVMFGATEGTITAGAMGSETRGELVLACEGRAGSSPVDMLAATEPTIDWTALRSIVDAGAEA